jgi:hypothetical protein
VIARPSNGDTLERLKLKRRPGRPPLQRPIALAQIGPVLDIDIDALSRPGALVEDDQITEEIVP